MRRWKNGYPDVVEVYSGHSAAVQSLLELSDNSFLSGGDDFNIFHWKLGRFDPISSYTFSKHQVRALALISSNSFVSGGSEGIIKRWVFGSPAPVESFSGHTGPIRTIAILPDSSFISGGLIDRSESVPRGDSIIRRWKSGNSSPLENFAYGWGQGYGVFTLVSLNDNTFLAALGANCVLRWKLGSSNYLMRYVFTSSVSSLAILKDNTFVASTGGIIKRFSLDSPIALESYYGHYDWIDQQKPLQSGGFASAGRWDFFQYVYVYIYILIFASYHDMIIIARAFNSKSFICVYDFHNLVL